MDIVEKYIKRKGVQKKLTTPITEDNKKSLSMLVEYYGDDVFNSVKSPLTVRTINDTIPLMIDNDIEDMVYSIEAIKTVVRNSIEHYKLIYGDNAESVYDKKTQKSIQSKENFIKRYGEENGKKKWKSYLKARKNQNSLEAYIEKYGEDEGVVKYDEYVKQCSYSKTLPYYEEKYGPDLGEELYYKRYPKNDYGENYKQYKNAVYRASNKIYEENIDALNPERHPRTRMGVEDGWQLDHIKPVYICFREGLSVDEASQLSNLQMLPWKENLMRYYNAKT